MIPCLLWMDLFLTTTDTTRLARSLSLGFFSLPRIAAARTLRRTKRRLAVAAGLDEQLLIHLGVVLHLGHGDGKALRGR